MGRARNVVEKSFKDFSENVKEEAETATTALNKVLEIVHKFRHFETQEDFLNVDLDTLKEALEEISEFAQTINNFWSYRDLVVEINKSDKNSKEKK